MLVKTVSSLLRPRTLCRSHLYLLNLTAASQSTFGKHRWLIHLFLGGVLEDTDGVHRPLIEGVGAPNQFPLGSVASYLTYVDVRLNIPMTRDNNAGTTGVAIGGGGKYISMVAAALVFTRPLRKLEPHS